MMTYSMIRICIFVLFLHSLQCTPTNDSTPTEDPTTTDNPTPTEDLTTTENPTPTDDSTPNIDVNAFKLYKAMKGFGTDEDAIINVVINTSYAQRQEIRNAYQYRFQKDLIEDLQSELSGVLKTVIVGMMMTKNEFYSYELNDALLSYSSHISAVAEILGSLDISDVRKITSIYEREFGKKLVDEIVYRTTGSCRNLFVKLCNCDREYHEEVDVVNATRDSHNLIEAGRDYMCPDDLEETLTSILASNSVPQLKKIFEEYSKVRKRGVISIIKRLECSELMEFLLTTLVRRVISTNEYFADLLYEAMRGIGTNNRQLIRIIVGRSDIDLDEIKKSYESKYNSSLIRNVADETSGDFQTLLIQILDKN